MVRCICIYLRPLSFLLFAFFTHSLLTFVPFFSFLFSLSTVVRRSDTVVNLKLSAPQHLFKPERLEFSKAGIIARLTCRIPPSESPPPIESVFDYPAFDSPQPIIRQFRKHDCPYAKLEYCTSSLNLLPKSFVCR